MSRKLKLTQYPFETLMSGQSFSVDVGKTGDKRVYRQLINLCQRRGKRNNVKYALNVVGEQYVVTNKGTTSPQKVTKQTNVSTSSNDLVIEKNIPMPTERCSYRNVLYKMKKGDSILIPATHRPRVFGAAWHANIVLTSHKVDNEYIRVWKLS